MIPTLSADSALDECLRSLEAQTRHDIEVIVVDNSGRRLVGQRAGAARLIENAVNVGFGTAINQGIRASSAPFIATLNDDAIADPGWIEALLRAAEPRPEVGMCASQVRLYPAGGLDSAGMLLCADGSSKQRGHGRAATEFAEMAPVLLPSGSAALYRRSMLDQIGGFDDDFFLYCEDTDLGLRARWAGWRCLYVPDAIVHHRYSHSAGRSSALKAYYVERNRLFVVAKNFPLRMLALVPIHTAIRYAWHTFYMLKGTGAAADFRQEGSGAALIWFVIRAHLALAGQLRNLLKKRRGIRATARITAPEFMKQAREHAISARQVAAH